MCGIYGMLSLRSDGAPSLATLRRMAAVTVHRGPDDEGQYGDEQVALGMRRLSIIDVAGGHQPIANEDGAIHVVCNGEIYNYRELAEELVLRGHRFRTQSDTEVLVHLYEQHGDDFVRRLNGMFAFALWDARRRRLLIGRDRLGIKPLYYQLDGRRLTFASEAKAVLAALDETVTVDPLALRSYLELGYVAAPRSMFKGIAKLRPGFLMICERGRVDERRYWSPAGTIDRSLGAADWSEAFLGTVERAVCAQMVSDVPLGAFLSGGIDSSTIVAFMAAHASKPIKTYSIGFAGSTGASYYNELPWARQVAERFGTDHREILVKPDVLRLLPQLLWHMDEPVADGAFVTTYLVAQFAREDVTVILSGVGGDELFGGYWRYLGTYYDRFYGRLPGWLRRGVAAPLIRALPSDRHSPVLNLARHLRTYALSYDEPLEERYRSYVQVFGRGAAGRLLRGAPGGEDRMAEAFREAAWADDISRAGVVDLLTQLPDDLLLLTDKMTMATSLECRVPLLDNTVLDLSLTMPGQMKIRGRELKHVMKQALKGLLPDEILHRKKRGFGAPMGAWFRHELAPLVRHTLSREAVEKRGLLEWDVIEPTIALHQASREDYTDHLLALVNLELWARIYLDGRSWRDVASEVAGEVAR